MKEVFQKGWLRFDVADEFRGPALQGAPAAGRAFASEAARSVGRNSIETDVCISVVFQFGAFKVMSL
jgi:hypothetical protein